MKSIAFLILFFLPLVCSAQHRVGNGGSGKKIGPQIYLTDLIAEGIFIEPVVVQPVPEHFSGPVFFKFQNKNFPRKTIAAKLSEIYSKDKVFALSLMAAMQKINWEFVLADVSDEDYVQISLHEHLNVKISSQYWDVMPENHKVALIFQETLNSLIDRKAKHAESFYTEKSKKLLAYLFSKTFTDVTYSELNEILEPYFPGSYVQARLGPIHLADTFWSPQVVDIDFNRLSQARLLPYISFDSPFQTPVFLFVDKFTQRLDMLNAITELCATATGFGTSVYLNSFSLDVTTQKEGSTSDLAWNFTLKKESQKLNSSAKEICQKKITNPLEVFIETNLKYN